MNRPTRTFALRMSEILYQRAKRAANHRGTSLSDLIRQSLTEITNEDLGKELTRQYEELGQCCDNDVEFAIHAQSDVMIATS